MLSNLPPTASPTLPAIPFVLVLLYEVGIRLKQALRLSYLTKRPEGRSSVCVLQALTLLRVAFDQLFRSTPALTAWRREIDSNLQLATDHCYRRLGMQDPFDESPQFVEGLVGNLILMTTQLAQSLKGQCPTAEQWFRLGKVVVDATIPSASEEDKQQLAQLLASVNGKQTQLCPKVSESSFDEDCPGRDWGFRYWHHVELGLKELQNTAASGSTQGPAEPKVGLWAHDNTEEVPPEFQANGPLEGTLQDLGKAIHPFPVKGDRRYIQNENRKGHVWVQQISGHLYRIYFKDQGRFVNTKTKLETLQNDKKPAPKQQKRPKRHEPQKKG